MSSVEPADPLTTRVGRISPTELHFRGHEVRSLLGCGYWDLVSLSVAGPELTPETRQLLDRLTTCMLACDPRIWPLKIVQLSACHGRASTGLGAGIMAMESSPLSYWVAGAAAAALLHLRSELEAYDEGRVEDVWRDKSAPPGFGVHGRDVDQRVSLFREWRATSETTPGTFERLLLALEEVVEERLGKKLRIDGLAGAILLDIGFSPPQIAVVAGVVQGFPNIVANAFEGSQRGPVLCELPAESVRYSGEMPRRSRRSQDAVAKAT